MRNPICTVSLERGLSVNRPKVYVGYGWTPDLLRTVADEIEGAEGTCCLHVRWQRYAGGPYTGRDGTCSS